MSGVGIVCRITHSWHLPAYQIEVNGKTPITGLSHIDRCIGYRRLTLGVCSVLPTPPTPAMVGIPSLHSLWGIDTLCMRISLANISAKMGL